MKHDPVLDWYDEKRQEVISAVMDVSARFMCQTGHRPRVVNLSREAWHLAGGPTEIAGHAIQRLDWLRGVSVAAGFR